MPYKDKAKQLEAQRKWYAKNKARHKKTVAENNAAYRRECNEKMRALKAGKTCSRCPEGRWQCLDYHHIDPSTKEYTVGKMVAQRLSWELIEREISKCILLCANCHRIEHMQDSGQ